MVCAVHNKFNATCYCAKFSDDKPVPYKIVVMSDVIFKMLGVNGVIVIGVVTHNYVLASDCVFDVAQAGDMFVRIVLRLGLDRA